MKKRILLLSGILLCVSSFGAIAQETPNIIVPGTYYQDNVINNYAGTWKWTNGTDEFTIVLVKKKCNLERFSVDVLSGGYRYVKNGVEQINTLSDVNIDINAGGTVASLESFVRTGNKIGFTFFDRGKGDKRGRVSVTITPMGNTYSMVWKLSGTGAAVIFPGDPVIPDGYSVPIDAVLIKQ
jgi:hypothetical protein